MSVLTIELSDLKIHIEDYTAGDPHVIIEQGGANLRIEAVDVRRVSDVLCGATAVMEPEPLKLGRRLATAGYHQLADTKSRKG